MISVALIEDNRLVREGLVELLNKQADIRVVAARAGVDTTVLRKVNPQVVLLDLGLRNGDSLRLAQKVRTEFPKAKIIVMDLLPAHEDIVSFVQIGVAGFIMKNATIDDLMQSIRSVMQGAHVLPTEMADTLFSEIAKGAVTNGAPALDGVRMTPREREVIAHISEGLSNKEIAAELKIATHTVKSHVRNIMEKLALHTRLQIAAYAHEHEV